MFAAIVLISWLALPDPPSPGPAAAGTEWGIPAPMLARLGERAAAYAEYAVRFTCDESVRLASYDGSGQADKEKFRRYSYLLERGADVESFREVRMRLKSDGTPRSGEVEDAEAFPPAYAWVFLFGESAQPFFLYRDLGERIEGFDWVREIEFRGALPFTDGRDIRQWEGTVLVDALTMTPLEIRAEPSLQRERVKLAFARWQQAFSFIGIRFAPRPKGFRCRVVFGLRQDGLTFPTELRYDTFVAVSSKATEPVEASIRSYERYRFFKTETTESEAERKP